MVKYYPYDMTTEERIAKKQETHDVDEELAKRFISARRSWWQELPIKYSSEEMEEMRIPEAYRNPCAHLHVKYTDCQVDKKAYLRPWRCQLEEARLKRCLYKLYLRDLRRSEQLFRAEYKLRLIYEELEKKGVKLPMARRWNLRESEIDQGRFYGLDKDSSL